MSVAGAADRTIPNIMLRGLHSAVVVSGGVIGSPAGCGYVLNVRIIIYIDRGRETKN